MDTVLELQEVSQDCYGRQCQHCQKMRAAYARGLCRKCYLNPEIRMRFSLIKVTRVNTHIAQGKLVLPEQPTNALPGTEEKVQVLMRRAEEGTLLFHPNDRKDTD